MSTFSRAVGIAEKTLYNYEGLGREALTRPEADRTPRQVVLADFVLRLDMAQEEAARA